MDVVWGCVCVQPTSPVSHTWDLFTTGNMSDSPLLLPEAQSDLVRLTDILGLCQPVQDFARSVFREDQTSAFSPHASPSFLGGRGSGMILGISQHMLLIKTSAPSLPN